MHFFNGGEMMIKSIILSSLLLSAFAAAPVFADTKLIRIEANTPVDIEIMGDPAFQGYRNRPGFEDVLRGSPEQQSKRAETIWRLQ